MLVNIHRFFPAIPSSLFSTRASVISSAEQGCQSELQCFLAFHSGVPQNSSKSKTDIF